jgi:hypothetical protein
MQWGRRMRKGRCGGQLHVSPRCRPGYPGLTLAKHAALSHAALSVSCFPSACVPSFHVYRIVGLERLCRCSLPSAFRGFAVAASAMSQRARNQFWCPNCGCNIFAVTQNEAARDHPRGSSGPVDPCRIAAHSHPSGLQVIGGESLHIPPNLASCIDASAPR